MRGTVSDAARGGDAVCRRCAPYLMAARSGARANCRAHDVHNLQLLNKWHRRLLSISTKHFMK